MEKNLHTKKTVVVPQDCPKFFRSQVTCGSQRVEEMKVQHKCWCRRHVCGSSQIFRHVTRGGKEGGGLTCPFSNIEKKCPNLGENAMTVVIYGLNISFITQLQVSRRKNWRFFPTGPFFLVLYMTVYQSALIPKKLPCPKKFLVTWLILFITFNISATIIYHT